VGDAGGKGQKVTARAAFGTSALGRHNLW
jgi:hypothetical protein